MKKIRVFRTDPRARLPKQMTTGAAGYDLFATLVHGNVWWLPPGQRVLIPTRLIIEIPYGYEGQIRPRSGLAAREMITVLNSPGTIDSDYRGEVFVLIFNASTCSGYTIHDGDRIAQLVIKEVPATFIEEVANYDDLLPTARGTNGCGSTGSK